MVRGFVLQPTYRMVHGRPQVLLYGTLEEGGSFLVRDDREVPRFWIRDVDANRAAGLGAKLVPEDPPRSSMRGDPLRRVEISTPPEAPPLRDRLVASGVPCFEADVRFAYRYLIDRGVRGTLSIEGEHLPGRGVDAVFHDPEVRPAEWTPSLSVLSFDIETDPTATRLLSIGLHGCGLSEVLLLTGPGQSYPAGAVPCPDERALLHEFATRVREADPDVLTGWNCIDFDLAVMLRVADRMRVPFEIGRGPGPTRVRPAPNRRGTGQATIPGRVVLDGIDLVRGAFMRVESYALNSVARHVLGRGKTVTGRDRAGEILEMFRNDRVRFVEYNLNDARLVTDILDKLDLVTLAVERSRLTGMPPDRVAASIASFDFLYLSELGRRNIVAPSVRRVEDGDARHTEGGYVMEPTPGLYENVLVMDFKSLYPSIIRTFQIDPLGHVAEPRVGDDPIIAPNGAAFRREPGILPRLLDDLFPRREAARRDSNAVASQAIKILMNSFYGVLGTPACRFHAPELANAITSFGRTILLWSRDRIEAAGHRVLYGDTDSLFVLSGRDDAAEARRVATYLVDRINRELATYVAESWRVESRLELEFETLYLRLMMPHLRGAATGARKRYAGLIDGEDGPEVVFTGMEVVRRDWTALAREVQRALYERMFHDRAVGDYLRQIVADVRDGKFDDRLVYRKGVRKDLSEYAGSNPPHVVAARKLDHPPGRSIAYVITEDGPEPIEARRHGIDHEHYVQKQVRPVAEPVLELLELDFDRVVGDDTQMRLF